MISQNRMGVRALALVAVITAAALALPDQAWAQTASPAATAAPATTPSPASSPAIDTAAIIQRLNQEFGVDVGATTDGWQRHLDRIEKGLDGKHPRYAELNASRDELQQFRSQVADFRKQLQPRFDATKAQIDTLGPPPAAGQPAEPEQAALNRAALNYRLALLSTTQAAVNSANLRIDRQLSAIEDMRRQNFASALLQPVPRLYAYDTWASVPDYGPWAVRQLGDMVATWWKSVSDPAEIVRPLVEAAIICLALAIAARFGVRRLRRWPESSEPPFWRRASSAAGVILLRALPVVVPVLFFYGVIVVAQGVPENIGWLFYLAAQSLVILATVTAMATTVFAPAAPRWRLVPASDAGAARLCGLIILLALVYSATSLLSAVTRLIAAPFALTIAVALPSSLVLAVLVIAIMRTPLGAEERDTRSRRLLRAVRWPVWAMVIAIVVSALSGYLALARFLAQQLVVTGSILALAYLLLLWIDGLTQGLSEGGASERWLGLDGASRARLALPLGLLAKFAILVLAVPLIMLQWGYSWPDVHEWIWQLLFNFHVGNTEVTLAALSAAFIVFVLGYAAARLFQGWLDGQVLRPAGISDGVRNSIRTWVGYAGILLAALLAFSYAGFNLSSLAIVAGAFSIGIGFGLQNLVNNFVSGLILLAERPIRVGDMVVVGGEEGYVRKISVRATEVETFDRANVIIPNSFFISEKVKNWTFRNSVRRLAISIGTSYGSDARQVRAVLLKVAYENLDVLRSPEPYVDLKEFAASSLSFTLYVYIADIAETVKTRTDLSIAILEAFAAASIAIPTGPAEIGIRNLDWLRDAVTEYTARGAGGGAGNGGVLSGPTAAD